MDKNKKIDLNSLDTDTGYMQYAIKLASLKKALAKLNKNQEIESEMYQSANNVIQGLDGLETLDESIKDKNQICLKDAASLLDKMTHITNHYLEVKNFSSDEPNKIKKHTTELQEECKILAKETDRVFSKVKRKELIKKIVAGVVLFLAAVLLAAAIFALIAATQGSILGISIPTMSIALQGTYWVGFYATAYTSASVTFTAAAKTAIATGAIFATLAGMGFFGSAAMLRSGVKKRPHHHLGHFTKASERAIAHIPHEEPKHKKHKKA